MLDRIAGDRRQLAVGNAEHAARQPELSREVGAKQRWVVGAERDGDPGVEELADRMPAAYRAGAIVAR